MFSFEFYNVFQNTFTTEHLRGTTSENYNPYCFQSKCYKWDFHTSFMHFKRPIVGITKLHEILSSWIIISKINFFLKFSWAIHGLMKPFFASSSLAFEAVAYAQRCSINRVFVKILQTLHEDTCAKVSFLKNFIKKESLAKIFSFKFCEIFKNTFFMEHHRWLFLTVLLWKIKRHTSGRFLIDIDLWNLTHFLNIILVSCCSPIFT